MITDAEDAVGIDARGARRGHVVLVPAHVVEVRTAIHDLDLEVDAHVAELRLHRLRDVRPRAAERREEDLEVLPVLLADRSRPELPARGVEDRLRLGGIEGERLLDRVIAGPHAFGQRTDGHVVHAEEDLVDDQLPVDGPVHRLAHGVIVGRRLRDVHAESEGVARPR